MRGKPCHKTDLRAVADLARVDQSKACVKITDRGGPDPPLPATPNGLLINHNPMPVHARLGTDHRAVIA